jgi:acyl-coenzyme A thioesterase 13
MLRNNLLRIYTNVGFVTPIASSSCRRIVLKSPQKITFSTSSFIDKAAHHGAKSLLGSFPSYAGRFDECLRDVLVIDKVDSAKGEIDCQFTVEEKSANGYGTLHGGFIATIVDVVGTLALLAKDHNKPGVSLDLNVSYIQAAQIGEKIVCKGKVLKLGNSFGFTEVELVRESDGKLIAKGRHTKAFPAYASGSTASTTHTKKH